MTRILIVGLTQRQHADVKREFDNVFDLRFSAQDDTPMHAMRSLAGCERVLAMVEYIDHKRFIPLKASGVPLQCVKGSTSALRRELRALAGQGAAA
jgi:hypothetical protein